MIPSHSDCSMGHPISESSHKAHRSPVVIDSCLMSAPASAPTQVFISPLPPPPAVVQLTATVTRCHLLTLTPAFVISPNVPKLPTPPACTQACVVPTCTQGARTHACTHSTCMQARTHTGMCTRLQARTELMRHSPSDLTAFLRPVLAFSSVYLCHDLQSRPGMQWCSSGFVCTLELSATSWCPREVDARGT